MSSRFVQQLVEADTLARARCAARPRTPSGMLGCGLTSVDMADNCQEDTPILNSFVINEGGLEDEVKTTEEAGSELRDGRSC